MTSHSAGTIAAALAFIPADDRELWVRVGMAIHSERPDDEGFSLFDGWSQSAEGYDGRAVRDTWRSFRPGGKVTIGTLLHEAKQRGFQLAPPAGGSQPRRTAADVAAAADRERAQAQRDSEQADAALAAQRMWDAAAVAGESPYLARKGVQAHGVRFQPDGTLLVPVRLPGGELINLQRIAPEPQLGGSGKRFLPRARKSGGLHWCGEPHGAVLLLTAEGYATAASLHDATGYPVAVAFDAGNLLHVAKSAREGYPLARILVCGDDDAATAARTGKNPGREKALAAARACGGRAVFPVGLSDGASDFNDLAALRGVEAVRTAVAEAVATWDAENDQAAAAIKADEPVGFRINRQGVWHVGVDQDGKSKPPEWVCSPLDVSALTRDQDGHGWGYLLDFEDPLGRAKQWAMPARMLSGDGGEYRCVLLGMGLRIASTSRGRNLLTQFIQTRQPGEFAQCTDRIGWHGHSFVLPHETIGETGERIVFQSESAMENTFRQRGTAAQWRDRVGALCAGNSRMVFAISCGFAGPLLRPAGVESGGFHFRGDSSSGKTTALKLAASVYGGASYLQRWRTTDNALEAIAAQHSDVLLILDELAQVDPKTAGECAYMLANEQSKARATRNGAPRARLSWRLLFLSAGELGLADHMAEGMKRARTGQEVRMADIPADAGQGLGAFETIHDFAGGAALSRHLVRESAACYGTPGRAFIAWAGERMDTLPKRLRDAMQAAAASMVTQGASGQVERVAARFALVGVAGELATEAGLTGWQEGEATRAARTCFEAWVQARGGVGNGEVGAMLRQVRRFLETDGAGRFTWWHRAADDRAGVTVKRAGYRRMVTAEGEPIKTDSQHLGEYGDTMPHNRGEEVSVEFFVLGEVFRLEVCAGFDHLAVCRLLLERGHLIPEKGRTYDAKPRLPGLGHARCYRISPSIFTDEC